MKRYIASVMMDSAHPAMWHNKEVYLASDAEAAIAEARSDERERIIRLLGPDGYDYHLLHGWAKDGRDAAILFIKAYLASEPKKLEKLAISASSIDTDSLALAINKLIDAVNDLRVIR